MGFEYKRGLIGSILMVFLCAFFILGMEMSQRPDAAELAKRLLWLPEYSDGQYTDTSEALCQKLYSLGAKEVIAYNSAKNDTEFFIAEFAEDAPRTAVEIYEGYLAETETREAEDRSRIMLINQFALLVIYDENDTAKNYVLHYFGL